MRIVSLVPSATEMLFALGLGRTLPPSRTSATTRRRRSSCPRVTRDVIGPGLPPAEIDRAVRELTEQGQAIYELDEDALRRAQPDLIVTQALCAVCAVSYDDVKTVAERLDPVPEVVSLDPHTLGEVLGDVRTLAAGHRQQGRGRRPRPGRRRADRPRAAGGARRRARARGRAGVAGPDLRRRPLDAAADRVRGRHRRARHARRALRARPGRRCGRRGRRSWS